MRAGQLRERIHVQRRASAAGDGYGNSQAAFADLAGQPADGWSARIRPLRGGETVLAGRLAGTQAYEISTRYCAALADVGAGDRIVDARDATRIFNVRSVMNPDERGRELIFTCDTGVAT